MSIFDNLKIPTPATFATSATSGPDQAAEQAKCSNCSECSNAEYFEITRFRLESLAEEFNWPPGDLLDWYSGPMDIKDLAMLPIEDVRAIVQDYIANHDLCRGEFLDEYPGYTGGDTQQPVACSSCLHFIPDAISPGGIGDCLHPDTDTVSTIQRLPWPNKERHCQDYLYRDEGE